MKLWCLLVASLLGSGVAFGQAVERPLDFGSAEGAAALAASDTQAMTFRSGVDLVALSVVVTDAQQKFVGGLTADHFAVFEDGVQQHLSFFTAVNLPLDLAILLDTSASMTDKIETAQEAAIGFVSTLRPEDRLLVMDIKDATNLLAPLSGDFDAAKAAIRGTVPRGGTALYNGLYLTLRELARERSRAGEVRRQAIVVLSDGDDTTSLIGFDEVMELAKESGIAVYTITLKSPWAIRGVPAPGQRSFPQSEFTMRALAQETGARAFFPTEITDLAGVYDAIAEELATQYTLGYSSKNPKRDGTYRRVIVRVAEMPGAQARTRAGYLAARAERGTR